MTTEPQTDPNAKGVNILTETNPERQAALALAMMDEIYGTMERYGLDRYAGTQAVMSWLTRDLARFLVGSPDSMMALHEAVGDGVSFLGQIHQILMHEVIDGVHNRTNTSVQKGNGAAPKATQPS